jgi:hypothetical protein
MAHPFQLIARDRIELALMVLELEVCFARPIVLAWIEVSFIVTGQASQQKRY